MPWNPANYLKFGSARLRPAIDLLNGAINTFESVENVKSILDLGCGPGNITEILCKSFPHATVDGLDSSVEMIDEAMKSNKDAPYKDRISFRVGSIEDELKLPVHKKYDLVYSNAALHWTVDHVTLFPNLLKKLVNDNGGVLAVQMPDTRTQPSHLLMETAALRSGVLNSVIDVRIPRVEYDPDWYYNLLSSLCKNIDLWTTDYVQQLPATTIGHDLNIVKIHPVLEWTRTTGLKPILEALGGESNENCQKYLREYELSLHMEYPIINMKNKYHSNGKLIALLPYKRFFMVCTM